MNIFLRELKANLKSLLIWAGIAVLFTYIGFTKYSAYYEAPEILDVLNDMPQALLNAFNMQFFDLTTITGFYGVMFAYFGLLLAISAGMWGSDIISKEERDKTVEFSLTLPVTRGELVTAKIGAALVNSIVLNLITWGALVFSAQQYNPGQEYYDFVALGMVALFLMQLIFLAIGILLGCAMKQHKRSSAAAVSVLLVTYFFSIISGLYDKLDFLKYFSPFKYFDPLLMLNESRIDLLYVWLSLGIIIVSLGGAYYTYSRRDLYI